MVLLFFIYEHLITQFNSIKDNNFKLKKIKNTYGDKFVNEHIINVVPKSVPYSYRQSFLCNLALNKFNMVIKQIINGGSNNNDNDDYTEIENENLQDEEINSEVENKILDDTIEDNFDIDELVEILKGVSTKDTSKEIEDTKTILSNALKEKDWFNAFNSYEVSFDTNIYTYNKDTNINDVYIKYIYYFTIYL